jgi:hypothetical protein
MEGNRMFEDAQLAARRGRIRCDGTTGEIIANAAGVTVPARSTSPPSSAIPLHSSPPAKVEHDPQAPLALPSPASPPDSELLHESMPPLIGRSFKNGSSVDGNNEEEKSQ